MFRQLVTMKLIIIALWTWLGLEFIVAFWYLKYYWKKTLNETTAENNVNLFSGLKKTLKKTSNYLKLANTVAHNGNIK